MSILRDWRDGVRKGQLEQCRKDDCANVDSSTHKSRSGGAGAHRRSHSSPSAPRPSFLWQLAKWCGRSGVISVDNDKSYDTRRSSNAYGRHAAPITDGHRRGSHRYNGNGCGKAPVPQHPMLRQWRQDVAQKNGGSRADAARSTPASSIDVAADDLIQLGTYAAHWKSAGKLDVTTAAALRRVL